MLFPRTLAGVKKNWMIKIFLHTAKCACIATHGCMARIVMRFQLGSFDNIVIITKMLLVDGNFLTILVSQFVTGLTWLSLQRTYCNLNLIAFDKNINWNLNVKTSVASWWHPRGFYGGRGHDYCFKPGVAFSVKIGGYF